MEAQPRLVEPNALLQPDAARLERLDDALQLGHELIEGARREGRVIELGELVEIDRHAGSSSRVWVTRVESVPRATVTVSGSPTETPPAWRTIEPSASCAIA